MNPYQMMMQSGLFGGGQGQGMQGMRGGYGGYQGGGWRRRGGYQQPPMQPAMQQSTVAAPGDGSVGADSGGGMPSTGAGGPYGGITAGMDQSYQQGGYRPSPIGSRQGPDYYSMDTGGMQTPPNTGGPYGGWMGGQGQGQGQYGGGNSWGSSGLFGQPQAQQSQPFIPSPQLANSQQSGQVMSQLATNNDGSGVNINDYGSMWQMAGGADLTGQREQAQQQAMGQQQAGQDVNKLTKDPSYYNFGVSSPTYMPSMTALTQGFTNQRPTDPNMVWGMGNNGGTPGWSYQPGYGGYRG